MTKQEIKNNAWKVVAVSERDGLTFWTIRGGIDRMERTFWVKHPPTATTAEHRPVLLVFHGYGGSSSSSRRSLEQWKPLATDLNMWLIAPDGAFKGWNAVDCCGDAIAYNIHETDFIEAILHFLQQEYETAVDAQTVVATGHSNGGFLTSLLGQQHPAWLKAILPVAGYQYHNYENLKPMSIFMHHGQNDTQVPVQGWCHANTEQRRQRPHHAYDGGGGARWLIATKEHHDDDKVGSPQDIDQCMSLQRVFEIWLETNSCKSTTTHHHQDDLKICQVGVSCQFPTELCIWKNSGHSGNYTNLIPNASRAFLSAVLEEEDIDLTATFVVAPEKVILVISLVLLAISALMIVLLRNHYYSQRRSGERQVTDATELVPIARDGLASRNDHTF